MAQVRFPDLASCGLSLWLLYSAPRGFSSATPIFPSLRKSKFDLICVDLLMISINFTVSPISASVIEDYTLKEARKGFQLRARK